MKQIYTLMAALSLASITSAQVNYVNGYFTDNAGKRTECLVRPVDSRNNPKKFSYKMTMDGAVLTGTITDVQEFGVDQQWRFVRYDVEIDRSGNDMNNINEIRDPQFTKEQLFLKVLLEGPASLYAYSEGTLTRYFFSTAGTATKQLVYKKYLAAQGGIAENNLYREQLWQQLRCDKLTMQDMENLVYDSRNLLKVFTTYNECQGGAVVNYEQHAGKTKIRLGITAGANIAGLTYYNSNRNPDITEYDTKAVLRIGAEAEFLIPFNRYKWSLFVEPNYHAYKATSPTNDTVSVSYKVIQLPVGIRHYMTLSPALKLFINGTANFNFNAGSEFNDIYNDLNITSTFNFGLGAGLSFNDRLHLEYRFNTETDILDPYTSIKTEYNCSGIFLRYTLK